MVSLHAVVWMQGTSETSGLKGVEPEGRKDDGIMGTKSSLAISFRPICTSM